VSDGVKTLAAASRGERAPAPTGRSPASAGGRALRAILRSPMACIGVVLIGAFVGVAALADVIAPHGYAEIVTTRAELPPTPPTHDRLLGTDFLGRDIWSRLVHGSRVSLMVGIVAESIALALGVAVGATAGYFGGTLDAVLMRVTDLVFSLPVALIAIVILGTFPSPEDVPLLRALPYPSLAIIFVVLGFLNWPATARLIRGQILVVKELDFTAAARALGASDARILVRHVIPNSLAPVFVAGTIGVASNILTEAWLSFLGLGAKPPLPSWGSMIAEGQSYLADRPWVCLAPGVAILVTVLGFNLLGDGLRDALDPRLAAGRKA
jgi:ABC-type dipeptide/oligopeptide/nickel transport system permease subunit